MNFKPFLYESINRPLRFISNIIDTPAVILIYHRVIELEHDPQFLSVKPENFYNQIKHLRESYNLVSIDEFSFLINTKKKIPEKTLILTFDDGYFDNYLNAVPILEQLNSQALFYICTELIDTKKEIWWDELERIFLLNQKLPGYLKLKISDREYFFKTSIEAEINGTYLKLHPLIKYLSKDERNEVMKALLKWAGLEEEGRESHRFMSSAEVIQMSKSPSAVIGAHTHTHTPLSILSYDEQRSEILKSKMILENITGKIIKHFSYPFGLKKDFNADTIRICDEMNFDFVCANYYSQVHQWTNKYSLPRILIRDWKLDYFKKQMKFFFRY